MLTFLAYLQPIFTGETLFGSQKEKEGCEEEKNSGSKVVTGQIQIIRKIENFSIFCFYWLTLSNFFFFFVIQSDKSTFPNTSK